MKKINLPLNSDAYKYSHFKMFDPDAKYTMQYVEARIKDTTMVPYGYRQLLDILTAKPTTAMDIVISEKLLERSGVPFNKAGWEYILERYHGVLPVTIEALDEGVPVPSQNAILQITTDDPNLEWLPSSLETTILRSIWYPITVATLSYNLRQKFLEYKEKTSDNMDVGYMLNDFGSRGVSSDESGRIGGSAHLLSFDGSDNTPAVEWIYENYGEVIPWFSIPSGEHSTITSWGQDREFEAVAHWLKVYDNSPLGLIIDSYNHYEFIHQMCTTFKDTIQKRKHPVILRPDSDVPINVTCGHNITKFRVKNGSVSNTLDALSDFGSPEYYQDIDTGRYYLAGWDDGSFMVSPVEAPHDIIKMKGIIRTLMDTFGYTTNRKGYKVLPDYIRVIQVDGVNPVSIEEILERLTDMKISVDNLVFGMGGKLLQGVDRDTYKFTCKMSEVTLDNGTKRDVYKDPIADKGKTSKKGKLAVVKRDGVVQTIRHDELKDGEENLLKVIYHNGEVFKDKLPSWSELKRRVRKTKGE